MFETTYDVTAIGNAIVDVIAKQSDDFLDEFGLSKGSMMLIDADRAVQLYDAMDVTTETSGGSAGNTAAGIASFGGSAAFIGKVGDDHLGRVFAHDSAARHVGFDVAPAVDGEPTGRSMIVVTPDAQRTMNTFLGAATTLYRSDISADLVSASKVLFCEGYIWDIDVTKDAIRHAIDISKAAGQKISFTLSDSFCVERHFDEWQELVDKDIDILFGNETELASLTQTENFDDAIAAMRGRCEILCATMGSKGSLIVTADETIKIEPIKIDVVDTTGAGDGYAAGMLYGMTNGYSLADSGNLGSAAAAEVISHMGARPTKPFAQLLDSLR